ncbi:hypothetical protein FPV67DRAFT_1486810 [Lyophyllum atratum]|nr:hypothetical protein FPV67DRAFT_1486810 [Lyophyllum atratum]
MDLASIHNKNDLTRAIADANQLSHAEAGAVASTALMVGEIQSFVNDNAPRSRFDPHTLILLPPSLPSQPSETVQRYLHRLALAALATAEEKFCSSILAGQGSESDDTGDVGLWLGSGEFQTPRQVLHALGLADWASDGEIAATVFPPLAGLAGSQLGDLMAELKDMFSFRAKVSMTDGIVLFFLVGRLEN